MQTVCIKSSEEPRPESTFRVGSASCLVVPSNETAAKCDTWRVWYQVGIFMNELYYVPHRCAIMTTVQLKHRPSWFRVF